MNIIVLIKFLILAIVQGITEPLPISSSGHVAIFGHLLGISLEGNAFLAFAAFINFGSTLAIIIYFWNDIKWLFFGGIKYITSRFENTVESKYLWNIFFSTLPLIAVTVLMEIFGIEIQDKLIYVAVALFITGMLLMLVSQKDGKLRILKMTKTAALIIGVAQAIAILPGISRSGITMVALLFLGFNKEDAFKYSFIMFIPASFGALLYSVYEMVSSNIPTNPYVIFTLIASIALSFGFTWLGLKIIKKVVVVSKLQYFAIYCFIVSLTIITIYIF